MSVAALMELMAGLEWARPWAWLLLPLPLILRGLLPAAAAAHGSVLRLPFSPADSAGGSRRRHGRARLVAAALCWILLCAAAAQPQRLGEISAPPSTGRDLMLAVDTSGSMAIEDMQIGGRRVDRFAAVRHVVGDFLERREGDRLGLLLFGQNAYLLVPLTFDRHHVRYQLETSVIGMAGRETAIGDAIGLGVKRLRERDAAGERVLVLLTDGVNNAGALDPLQAARLAAAEGVRVYTIGMGGDGGSTRVFGLQVATPGGEIDEASLTEIARLTGGRYFRARDTRDLANIYAELDRLEPVDQRAPPQRPREELYAWPLGGGVALGLLLALPLPRRRHA